MANVKGGAVQRVELSDPRAGRIGGVVLLVLSAAMWCVLVGVAGSFVMKAPWWGKALIVIGAVTFMLMLVVMTKMSWRTCRARHGLIELQPDSLVINDRRMLRRRLTRGSQVATSSAITVTRVSPAASRILRTSHRVSDSAAGWLSALPLVRFCLSAVFGSGRSRRIECPIGRPSRASIFGKRSRRCERDAGRIRAVPSVRFSKLR